MASVRFIVRFHHFQVQKNPQIRTSAFGNQSTRHTVKSCDELTVVSEGVVTS